MCHQRRDMRLLISFAALFLSVFLVQLGSGSLGPLDALSGTALGWTTAEIGLLGSAHFAGFFIGCWAMPRLIGGVGHSRAFAAAAAVGATGVLLHPVLEGPVAWAGLRVLSGMSVAGAYTAVESWLQAKLERQSRGRVFGIYRLVDLVGAIGSQGLIAVLEPAVYVSYNIIAIFCCLCLVPLALTRQVPPLVDHPPVLAPLRAWRISPLACFGIVIAGTTGSSFRMVGPVFGVEIGLAADQIAIFLIAVVTGAAIAQYPIGWLADKFDRRWVLISLSGGAIATCLAITGIGPDAFPALVVAAALFGATSLTIYSVSAAHANDYCPADFVVELNAALIFFFSAGAIAAPFVSARLMETFGTGGLFWFIATAHLVLIAFSLYRMTRRAGGAPATPYRYLPRTSMVLARLWGRRQDERSDDQIDDQTGAETPTDRDRPR